MTQTSLSKLAARGSKDAVLRGIAATAITLYQRHLSRRKGFCCSHRLLHGGRSCSGHVKHLILEEGLLEAVPLSRRRLTACREARYALHTSVDETRGGFWGWWRERRRRRHGCCDAGCDVCDLGCDIFDWGT